MTNKTTKKALLLSMLSMLLCAAMLVGTTFAWFTDSVTSGRNTIMAGNLDVELKYWNGTSYVDVTEETELFNAAALWEPGYTEVVYLQVHNAGTLALKYRLGVNIISETGSVNMAGENFLLSDYIRFGVIEGVNTPYADRAAARAAVTEDKIISEGYSKDSVLNRNNDSEYVALVVYMPEDVGNVANHHSDYDAPSINLGVNLVATQNTVESDDFGIDYDEKAEYRFFSKTYSFDSKDDLAYFDPALVNPNNTSGHGLTVADGRAVVNNPGAYIAFDADLSAYKYFVEYDVDLSALAEGKSIVFNSGNDGGYDIVNYISIVNNGGLKLSIGSAANNPTAYVDSQAIGSDAHIKYEYSVVDGQRVTAVTVTDGTNTYTAMKSGSFVADHNIFWDIEVSDPASGVAIDNFEFYATEYPKAETEPDDTYNSVTVTPETLATVTYENDTVYKFSGTFTDAVSAVNVPAGLSVVLDGTDATFAGQVKFTFGRIHDGAASSFDGTTLKEKTGSYTVQNFTTDGSISIGTINTNVNILNNKAQAIDLVADNTKMVIDGNMIDSKNATSVNRYEGTGDYGFYLFGFAYDMTFTDNTISNTYSHAFAICGGDDSLAENYRSYYSNKVSDFSKNTINMADPANAKSNDRCAIKIWADNTYAPQSAANERNAAVTDLMNTIRTNNTVNKTADTQNWFSIYNSGNCD